MQDSRELVEKTLQGFRPERAPIVDLLCNDTIIEHFGGGLLDGRDDKEVVHRAIGRAMDRTTLIFYPDVEGRTFEDEAGNRRTAERWTNWVTQPARTTEEQWARWAERDIERLEAEAALAAPEKSQVMVAQSHLNKRLNGSILVHCSISTGFNHAVFSYQCGLACFSFLWMLDPELTRRWLHAIGDAHLHQIERLAHRETSPLAIIWCDVAFKNGLMMSKQTFASLGLFDEIARFCDAFHSKGIQVIFHSDGNVMAILLDLIAAGIDGLNPIETAAGMDPIALRRRYPELILSGGVDTNHLLARGSPEDVRRAVRRLIDEAGSEGRLLLGGTAGEIDNTIPLANYLALYDEARKG